MAILHPFKALRPLPELVQEVACVPYDVINTAEARALATSKPNSFLHVIRPEIDFPEGIDEHADEVYAKGAENLKKLSQSDHFLQEATPSLYIYRLIMNGKAQTGIFACVAVSDYDENVILKHELTRPDKEDDRTRHILEQSAHAEPVMLAFKGTADTQQLTQSAMQESPLYDFVAEDGIQHTIWKVAQPEAWVAAFADIPNLYVADGHHRCKAASRTIESLGYKASTEAHYFPAVLFPLDEMQILPYNRIVYRLPQGKDAFLSDLKERFEVREGVSPSPLFPSEISLYLGAGKWYGLTLPASASDNAADQLDVSRLMEYILTPILNIQDARTDKNIFFVGGIRGTSELERLVDEGTADLGISMFPTQPSDLVAVSDAGLLMPPKSTWFEPKLRSGLLVHLF